MGLEMDNLVSSLDNLNNKRNNQDQIALYKNLEAVDLFKRHYDFYQSYNGIDDPFTQNWALHLFQYHEIFSLKEEL
jgi:hypothetical protein